VCSQRKGGVSSVANEQTQSHKYSQWSTSFHEPHITRQKNKFVFYKIVQRLAFLFVGGPPRDAQIFLTIVSKTSKMFAFSLALVSIAAQCLYVWASSFASSYVTFRSCRSVLLPTKTIGTYDENKPKNQPLTSNEVQSEVYFEWVSLDLTYQRTHFHIKKFVSYTLHISKSDWIGNIIH
jgi:hypothetical protein